MAKLVNKVLRDPEVRRLFEEEVLVAETVDTIDALLEDLNLAQRDLAERLGVTAARVSQILSGNENLTLRSLAHVGWALGISFRLDPVQMADRVGTPAVDDPPAPSWLAAMTPNARNRGFEELPPMPSEPRQRRPHGAAHVVAANEPVALAA